MAAPPVASPPSMALFEWAEQQGVDLDAQAPKEARNDGVTPAPRRALDRARAQAGKDAGMASVAAAQDRRDPTWGARMLELLRVLATTRAEFISDDLWALVEETEPKLAAGPDVKPKALGAVFLRAAREGLIQRTDRTQTSHYATRHLSPVPVWRSLIYRSAGARP